MNYFKVDNYIVDTPPIDIINDLKLKYPNKKLQSVTDKGTEIVLTCVNSEHAGGQEKNPDAHINLDSSKAPYGFCHCFGCGLACNFTGFIAHYFDSSVDYAKAWLIEKYGKKDTETVLVDSDIILNTKKAKYLDESVLNDYQPWTPYFAKRGLSRETVEHLKFRYDPIARQVLIPVYDIHNRLKMIAKRNIDTKFFYMDKNQEKEVLGLNIIQKNNIKNCIISEGPFDYAAGWNQNIPTIATLGNISDYQIKQINSSCITVLYTGFDHDAAGKNFTDLIKAKLDKRIIINELDFPKDKKDLGELTPADWQKIKEKYFQN